MTTDITVDEMVELVMAELPKKAADSLVCYRELAEDYDTSIPVIDAAVRKVSVTMDDMYDVELFRRAYNALTEVYPTAEDDVTQAAMIEAASRLLIYCVLDNVSEGLGEAAASLDTES